MNEFDARIAELRVRFVARAAVERVEIEAQLAASGWVAVRDICHGLSGLAGMFGLAAIGDAARALEDAVDDGVPEDVLRELAAVLLGLMKDMV